MKTRWMMTALALGTTVTLAACGTISGGGGTEEGNWELEENKEVPVLEAIFVSGHLGNYDACPDEGYTEAGGEDARAGGAPDGDEFAGDCAPDESGGCGTGFNCESALMTFTLENAGQVAAEGVSIEKIEILDDAGEVAAILPLIEVYDSATNEVYGGGVGTDEPVQIRIEFQGPMDVSEFVESQSRYFGSAVLRVTFSADDHDDIVVDTKAIDVISNIAT